MSETNNHYAYTFPLDPSAHLSASVTPLPVYTPPPPYPVPALTHVQVWGVTIGTAVLQTQLSQRLPADFVDSLPGGVSLAYSVIPVIPSLPEPAHTQVRVAFAQSIRVLWLVMIGIAGFGALAALLMKGLPLHTQVDERWGMEEKARRDEEAEEKGKDGQLERAEPTLL